MTPVWKKIAFPLLALASLSFSGIANATILWDYSPDATHASVYQSNWTNQAGGQNFLESVVFDSDVSITGMSIFGGTGFGSVGDGTVVKIFSGASAPGNMLFGLNETVDSVDSLFTATQSGLSRVHVTFDEAQFLAAGTYWFGMSGASLLVQAGLNNVQDNHMWQLSGDTPMFFPNVGDMAFQLEGNTASAVPEPATFALLALGLLGFAFVRRRQQ